MRERKRTSPDLFEGSLVQRMEKTAPGDYERLTKALATVIRWQGGRAPRTEIRENVLEHTMNMIWRLDQMVKEHPIIGEVFRVSDVKAMALMHDVGEIEGGDVTLTAQTESSNKVREQKELASAQETLRQLLSPELAEPAISFVHRYEDRKKNPTDAEARLVKLLDVLSGNYMAIAYMYRPTLDTGPKTTAESDEVRRLSIDRLIGATEDVFGALRNANIDLSLRTQAEDAILDVVTWDMVTYVLHGYANELRERLILPGRERYLEKFSRWGIDLTWWSEWEESIGVN